MPQGLQVCWWTQTSSFGAQQRDPGRYKLEGTFRMLSLQFGMQICSRLEEPPQSTWTTQCGRVRSGRMAIICQDVAINLYIYIYIYIAIVFY